jgi:hypothetical protein
MIMQAEEEEEEENEKFICRNNNNFIILKNLAAISTTAIIITMIIAYNGASYQSKEEINLAYICIIIPIIFILIPSLIYINKNNNHII